MPKVTTKQQYLIQNFIATAKINGISHLYAALPLTHYLMVDKKSSKFGSSKTQLQVGWMNWKILSF